MKLPKRQEGKLNIYFNITENSGVGLYRQFMFADELREQGLANILINDFTWGEKDMVPVSDKTLFSIANWADIIVTGRRDVGGELAKWGGIREFFNMPVIMDTDDNVRFVRPSNPGYQGYHPGSEAIMWSKMAFAKVYDAITVSTNNLKEFHLNEHPKIFVVPNSIDMERWKPRKRRKNKNKVRICFNGSSSHLESVNIIKEPVLRILREYPETVFVIPKAFKNSFKDNKEEFGDRIEFIEWIKLKNFPDAMRKLGIDIGLAPLADNLFNRSKSNLRWMEFSALKIPVIYSPVKAYENVVHEKTGLLAREREDWYNNIKRLVEDNELRKSLALNAYNEVREKFNIKINAPKVLPIYEDIIKKHTAMFGKKKRFKQFKTKKNELKWKEERS